MNATGIKDAGLFRGEVMDVSCGCVAVGSNQVDHSCLTSKQY